MQTFADSHALGIWLQAHQIDTTAWGQGAAKSIEDLWREVQNAESALYDEKPLRRVRVLELHILDGERQLMEAAQTLVQQVHASEALLDYLQALIAATRSGQWFVDGLSPRAGIAVLRVARARALMAERDYVAPDDIQAILPQAIGHRLVPLPASGRGPIEQVRAMVEATPIP